jgi:hypothetical protein
MKKRINTSKVKQKDRAGPLVEQFDYTNGGPLLALIIDGQTGSPILTQYDMALIGTMP